MILALGARGPGFKLHTSLFLFERKVFIFLYVKFYIINPRCACARGFMVVVSCVCLCVYVCLSANLIWGLALYSRRINEGTSE